jgi:hypothetical protein
LALVLLHELASRANRVIVGRNQGPAWMAPMIGGSLMIRAAALASLSTRRIMQSTRRVNRASRNLILVKSSRHLFI